MLTLSDTRKLRYVENRDDAPTHDEFGNLTSIHGAVAANVLKAWPDQADAILREIRWAGDHYYFNRWQMYIGVETDGYIHS